MSSYNRVSEKKYGCPKCKGNNREIGKPCPNCGFPLKPEQYADHLRKIQEELDERKTPKCTCCPIHKCV